MPFPKALPRKSTNRGRKIGCTRILTDTPEKDEIQEQNKRKIRTLQFDSSPCRQKIKLVPKKKPVLEDSSSDSDELELNDSSGDETFEPEMPEEDFDHSVENLEPGDFVLVKFQVKSSLVHYVGRVENKICSSEYEINFLRSKGKGFVFPNVSDISSVAKEDIVLKLSRPSKSGGNDRIFSVFMFDVNLNSFSNLR